MRWRIGGARYSRPAHRLVRTMGYVSTALALTLVVVFSVSSWFRPRPRSVAGSNRLALAAAVSGETVRTRLQNGDADAAAASLEAVAANDASVWSDLAAARYTIGAAGDPAQLPRALAAADAALQLDPSHLKARFNRALILERLGLRDQARAEWQAYLAADGGSEWAVEARAHLRQLAPIPPFKDELARAFERLAADPAAAHAFAREHRDDSRRFGQTVILGEWAAAEREGNHELAAKKFRVARELGVELARAGGDAMLSSLVAAIDRATPEQRSALVEAHAIFREGQKTYKNGEPAKATPLLLAAADGFDRGKSPAAIIARYYAANTIFDQGRIAEAEGMLQRLLASLPPQFMAQRAEILWQIGLVYLARGEWGPCIASLTESVAIFDRLGEPYQAAAVREILTEAYDRVGNRRAAWKERLIALRLLGRTMSMRLQLAIASMSRDAVMKRDWRTAASILGLEIDVTKQIGDVESHAEAVIRLARVHVETDKAAAANDLRDARTLLSQVSDPGYREHLEANALAVEALLAPAPQTSIALLTQALEFHRRSGRRMYIPELLFERGRALLAVQDSVRAAEDFEAAIAELETHRESLSAGEDRFGMFHDAEDLFDAAVTTALDRNDPATAFQYVERARARALLESLGATWRRVDPAEIPPRTLVLEYSLHDQDLAIFTVTTSGLRVVRRPIDRAALVREMNDHTRAARDSDVPVLRTLGRSLYDKLVAPVRDEVAGAETLVIVPDPVMASLPFTALVDEGGRYLIEDHPLVVDPSAAVFVQLARAGRRSADQNVLIVTGAEDLGRLPSAEREARAVAAAYRNVRRLTAADATTTAFAREAVAANAIHFVGHAVALSAGAERGYLALTNGGLDLSQIASLNLRATSFVVLAACATADGERPSSEGTISIARAFVAAGVPSVAATLWPIDDGESADFFPLIHRYRARGLTAAEAVRAAQLDRIHRSGGSTALWSSVQLIGN